MAYGEHWEWRAFGVVAPDLRRRILALQPALPDPWQVEALAALADWVERTDWIDFLPQRPESRQRLNSTTAVSTCQRCPEARRLNCRRSSRQHCRTIVKPMIRR